MTLEQFLVFMIFPVSALIFGYVAMKVSERETAKFDERRSKKF